MQPLDAEATRALLSYGALADCIRGVLRDKLAGRAYAPVRTSMPLPGGGALLLMPAADENIAITKLVTIHPGNAGRGLPVVQAEVLVFDAATGDRLLMLDGGAVTARRTAALSLLAAGLLTKDPHGPLLI